MSGRRGHPPMNVYRLTAQGRAALADKFDVPLAQVPGAGSISVREHAHVHALNSIRVALVLALRRAPEWRLAQFRPFWELRFGVQAHAGVLIPDAMVVLERADKTTQVGWALEVDLQTEGVASVLSKKAGRYREVLLRNEPLCGLTEYQVLFVAPRLRRVRSIARVLCRGFAADRFYVAELGPLADAQTALSPHICRASVAGDTTGPLPGHASWSQVHPSITPQQGVPGGERPK